MSGIKLTIASSVYTKPYKWIRSTSTAVIKTAVIRRCKNPWFKVSSALNSNSERESMTCTYGWRITTCAPLSLMAHDNKNLGFRGYNKRLSFLTRNSSSSSDQDKGVVNSSGVVTDMGTENKDDDWYENDQHRSSVSLHQSSISSPLIQHQQHSSKLLTLPTILTLGRVAAVPIFVCTFYMDSWWGTTATTSIFIAAAITDWLDGYIARKMRLGSAFGAFLDPVADKLMVAATLILLCTKPLEVSMFGQVPWLLTAPAIAIIGREITMSAVREWAASQNSKLLEAVAVNNLGKWKTATQMTALTVLLATRDSSLGGGVLAASGLVLLYISAWLAVWSLAVYMRKIWKVLLK